MELSCVVVLKSSTTCDICGEILLHLQTRIFICDSTQSRQTVLCLFRSRLAIIPQDPFLFSGTVRDNIDPAGLRSTDEIVDAVERCHLRPTVDRLGGLSGEVTEGGRGLSSGERQLVCLARALLCHAQVSLGCVLAAARLFCDFLK